PRVHQSKAGSEDKRQEQCHGIARVINSRAARYRIRRKSQGQEQSQSQEPVSGEQSKSGEEQAAWRESSPCMCAIAHSCVHVHFRSRFFLPEIPY
ncbi:unnamed protein product, partial [Staurois parvus]